MHFGARFYLPKLGRFASADTIVPNFANPQALNRYAFVLNNPLRYTDPTGHTSACANAAIADPECSAPSNDPVTYSNVYTGTGLEPEEVVFNNSSGGGTSVGGGDFCSQNPVACQFESDGGGDPVIQGPPASAPVTYLNTEGRLKDDGPRARFVNPFDDYYDPICPFTTRRSCAGFGVKPNSSGFGMPIDIGEINFGNGTIALNYGGALYAFVAVRGEVSLVADFKGNIAVTGDLGGGGSIVPFANRLGLSLTVTDAPSVENLTGKAVQIGGQIGEVGTVSAEKVFFRCGDSMCSGTTIGGGATLGFPVEIHTTFTNTWMLGQVNIRDAILYLTK
jgi:hypothetical protein